LVVNNFDILVGGFSAVTSKWARLYFTAFYLIGVLFILNVVISVLLDSYLTQMHQTQQAKKARRERRLAAEGEATLAAEEELEGASTCTASLCLRRGQGGRGGDCCEQRRQRQRRRRRRFENGRKEEEDEEEENGFAEEEALPSGERMLEAALVVAGMDGGAFIDGALWGVEGSYESTNLDYVGSSLVAEALLPQRQAATSSLSSSSSSSKVVAPARLVGSASAARAGRRPGSGYGAVGSVGPTAASQDASDDEVDSAIV